MKTEGDIMETRKETTSDLRKDSLHGNGDWEMEVKLYIEELTVKVINNANSFSY